MVFIINSIGSIGKQKIEPILRDVKSLNAL